MDEKTIFLPNIIGLFGAAVGVSIISSMGGVGGGGILIPLYAIIGNVPLKQAIKLSVMTILGNALVRAIYYSFKRHRATKERFLTDYNIVRLVVPFAATTAYLGWYLNKILPNVIIFAMIVILLIFLIYKSIKKTIAYIKKSKNQKSGIIVIDDDQEMRIPDNDDKNNEDKNNEDIDNGNNQNNENRDNEKHEDNDENDMDDIDIESQLSRRKGENKKFAINNLIYIFLSFVIIVIFSFLRKGKNGTIDGWLIYLGQVIIMVFVCHTTICHIFDIFKLRKMSNFNWVEGDIPWNKPKAFIKYSILALGVGFLSPLLGIGGSIIMNPIMIEFNMLPDVVVATSSMISFFSVLIAVIQILIIDGIIEWYFPILTLCGIFGAIIGLTILRVFKNSIRLAILVIIVIILIGSLVLLIIYNSIDFIINGISFELGTVTP